MILLTNVSHTVVENITGLKPLKKELEANN